MVSLTEAGKSSVPRAAAQRAVRQVKPSPHSHCEDRAGAEPSSTLRVLEAQNRIAYSAGEGDCTLQQSCSDPRCTPAPWRILVVEDEVLIRLLIVDILIHAGFHVIQAASADEALRVLQSSVEVDLVMTDIRMPGSLDGLELASRVRANWPALRIVIVSSDASSLRPDLPADAVIAKPFSPIEFVDRVKQLLGPKDDQP